MPSTNFAACRTGTPAGAGRTFSMIRATVLVEREATQTRATALAALLAHRALEKLSVAGRPFSRSIGALPR